MPDVDIRASRTFTSGGGPAVPDVDIRASRTFTSGGFASYTCDTGPVHLTLPRDRR